MNDQIGGFIGNINIGDTYYAVGPLQGPDGIEEWNYSADRYDSLRAEIGNMFPDKITALKYKYLLLQIKGMTHGL